MGGQVPKQLLELQGKPILIHTLLRFEECDEVRDILVAALPDWMEKVESLIREHSIRKVVRVVAGGMERQDSVRAALKEVSGDSDIILVHDAVRPFVSGELILRIIHAARTHGAAVPGIRVRDTVKRVKDGWVSETLSREGLWQIQTPQGFKFHLLQDAYAAGEGMHVPDDASLLERLGYPVAVIRGEPDNIKITTPEDLKNHPSLRTE